MPIALTVARDGAEALDILRDENRMAKPFVILTDLNMSGMSGHELIEEIRSDEMLQDSVIFVLSSSRLAGDIRQAYQFNVAGYLTKQSPGDALKRNVQLVFDYCAASNLPC